MCAVIACPPFESEQGRHLDAGHFTKVVARQGPAAQRAYPLGYEGITTYDLVAGRCTCPQAADMPARTEQGTHRVEYVGHEADVRKALCIDIVAALARVAKVPVRGAPDVDMHHPAVRMRECVVHAVRLWVLSLSGPPVDSSPPRHGIPLAGWEMVDRLQAPDAWDVSAWSAHRSPPALSGGWQQAGGADAGVIAALSWPSALDVRGHATPSWRRVALRRSRPGLPSSTS